MAEVIAPYLLVLGRTIEDSYLEYKDERLPGIVGVSVGIGALGGEAGGSQESILLLRIPLWRCRVEFDESARPVELYEVPDEGDR